MVDACATYLRYVRIVWGCLSSPIVCFMRRIKSSLRAFSISIRSSFASRLSRTSKSFTGEDVVFLVRGIIIKIEMNNEGKYGN